MNSINYIARTGTNFPSTVRVPDDDTRVLKPGAWNRKLGAKVTKGAWASMPIYCLTLEERKTCPSTCENWACCYGNHMPFAHRFEHGAELEDRLDTELAVLQLFHPRGFVVRLHVLGDFYSAEYVERWAEWLDRFPALHAYGYSAWLPDTAIGEALAEIHSDRFVVRTSGIDTKTVTDWSPDDRASGIRCPVQMDKAVSCGSCALCWSTDKVVIFKVH
ncbi:hypothetical protein [Telmatospirillum sp.]|uniref:GP88 family protein n=1 Tax=Telmatospirillum sp. TaxID=2079197 RepID=UPI00284F180C|nr:hypothetical protein [Telmatospirillum sp.]MDR3436387.1 hypothetical protein [Telmatospirillum sp.]